MADVRIDELKTLLPQCLLPDWVRLGRRLARLLRDQHHPDQREALLERLHQQVCASVALREERRINVPRVTYPPELPITTRKDEIVAAVRDRQVVVIAGETGSGKTTQIPKMCLEAGLGIEAKIGCTQPRRVAALSISRRIAEELNVTWGREVGCKIRFDDRSSPQTYIKLMTDGILLAETQGDPNLSEYNAIILDEAHERSLNIDFFAGPFERTARAAQGFKIDHHVRDHRYAVILSPLRQRSYHRSLRPHVPRSDSISTFGHRVRRTGRCQLGRRCRASDRAHSLRDQLWRHAHFYARRT